MDTPARHTAVTVLLGVALAGPLAAVAMAGLPRHWRGPWVPLLAAAITVAAVALLRRRPPSAGRE